MSMRSGPPSLYSSPKRQSLYIKTIYIHMWKECKKKVMKMDECLKSRCRLRWKANSATCMYFIVNNRNNCDFKNLFVFTLRKIAELNFYFSTLPSSEYIFKKNWRIARNYAHMHTHVPLLLHYQYVMLNVWNLKTKLLKST